jgi:DNA repair protein RadD
VNQFQAVRAAYRRHSAVVMQSPTGSGKTHIFAAMARSAEDKGRNIWIMVPRVELLEQALDKLQAVEVDAGIIAPGHQEDTAKAVHVVSKNTLIRRYDKIQRPPDFLIVDECHLALDRQKEIAARFPEAKLLGVTATPERLDGRGLSELYQAIVAGPTVGDLIDQGWLCDVRYFCPPVPGLKNLHVRGTDFVESDLAAYLEKRKIYGRALEHYQKHAPGKPALVYCRSVKAAKETADRFNQAGWRFASIDGTMGAKERRDRVEAIRTGALHGLTSCELVTYGLDIPRVECVIMLRPTLSRALFFQMVGRGLRISPGKKECVILDHVGNLQEHGHPLAAVDWHFDGQEKRKRRKEPDRAVIARLCPDLDYLYCDQPTCMGCEHNRTGRQRRNLEQVEGQLIEAQKPVKMADRPPDEQRHYWREIDKALAEYRQSAKNGKIPTGPLQRLLQICEQVKLQPMWAYHRLSSQPVDESLLVAIARIKRYHPWWIEHQRAQLRAKNGSK